MPRPAPQPPESTGPTRPASGDTGTLRQSAALAWRLKALSQLRRTLASDETHEEPKTPDPVAAGLEKLSQFSTIIAESRALHPEPAVAPAPDPALPDLRQLLLEGPQPRPLLTSWVRFGVQASLATVEPPPLERPLLFVAAPAPGAPAPGAPAPGAPAPGAPAPGAQPPGALPPPPVADPLPSLPEPAPPEPAATARPLREPDREAPPVPAHPRRTALMLAFGVLVAAFGLYTFVRSRAGSPVPPAAAPAVAPAPGPAASPAPSANWWRIASTNPAGEPVTLLAYRPALADAYSLTLPVPPTRGEIVWAPRYVDPSNYAAYGLQILTPDPPRVVLVRFAVVRGRESPHVQIPVSIRSPVTDVRTDVDASGIRLRVNGELADTWRNPPVRQPGLAILSSGGAGLSWLDSLRVEAP